VEERAKRLARLLALAHEIAGGMEAGVTSDHAWLHDDEDDQPLERTPDDRSSLR
jgi:hypothetical protein